MFDTDNDILDYYDINESTLYKIKNFCMLYLDDFNFNILDLYYYDELLVKIDDEVKVLIDNRIVKTKSNYKIIVEGFTKEKILNLIPNIKEEFSKINLTFKKTISAWELKSIIIKNKIVFYNYFKDYVFISLTANYENFIGEYLDYLKEYKNACHWLPQNQENNTYNMPDKYIVKDNKIKTTQQIKEEIRQRISVIRQGKAKEEVNNDNVIYLSQKTNNKDEDMPPAQFWGLLSLLMLFVIFIISCFVGMFL